MELYQYGEESSLPAFSFDNFLRIAYEHRAVKLPVNSIEDVLAEFKKTRSIYIDSSNGNKIQFELRPEHIHNLKEAYFLVQKIFNEFAERKINVRYFLRQYNVNGKIYLGMLNIYYSEGKTDIATLGVSEKNRIYFKIKLNSRRTYSFEADTVMSEYEKNIREDLTYFFQSMDNGGGHDAG
jgi:hypothetical protein